MKSITKNSLYNSIYSFSNVIFPLLITMYASRVLLAEGIGYVNFAKNIASYFVTIAALGIPNYGLREIAKVKDNILERNKTYSELFIINFFTSVLSVILYVILIINFDFIRIDKSILLCFGMLIFMNVFNIDWFYQGIEEYGYIVKRSLIVKIISFIATILFVKNNSHIIQFTLINVFSITFNYVLNVIHARKYVSITYKDLSFSRHFYPLLLIGLSIFLSTLYSKTDVTMLGIMKDNISVGLYTNSQKIIETILMLTISITAVYLPRLSELYEKNKNEFTNLISQGVNIVSYIAIPIMVYVFIFSKQIIGILFGESFIYASFTLKILSILIIVKSFGDLLCYQVALAARLDKIRLFTYVLAAISNIILNYYLIKIMSFNGAAIASVITELIVNVVQFVIIRTKINITINFKYIYKVMFSTFITLFLLFVINRVFDLSNKDSVAIIFIVTIFIVIIYILCNYILSKKLNVKYYE